MSQPPFLSLPPSTSCPVPAAGLLRPNDSGGGLPPAPSHLSEDLQSMSLLRAAIAGNFTLSLRTANGTLVVVTHTRSLCMNVCESGRAHQKDESGEQERR